MFDEFKGSIKMLLLLIDNPFGITRLEFLKFLKEQGVGGTAAYKAIEALKSYELISVYNMQARTGKQVLITELTKKGAKIAQKLQEIMKILEEE